MSRVVFHPRHYIIRVWDVSKYSRGVQTFHRDHDCFWILAAHLDMNLLAVGHDSGVIVFKLERERSAFVVYEGTLFCNNDHFLLAHQFATQKHSQLIQIRRAGSMNWIKDDDHCCLAPWRMLSWYVWMLMVGDMNLFLGQRIVLGLRRSDAMQEEKTATWRTCCLFCLQSIGSHWHES